MVASTKTKPAALQVDVDLRVPDDKKVDPFWLGTMPGCPVQNITVAGVSFPLYTGNPRQNESTGALMDPRYGAEVNLRKDQVEKVLKCLPLMVLRLMGPAGKKRGLILWVGSKSYQPQSNDEPLARYVYMARGHRQREFPPSMLKNDTAAPEDN